MQNKERIYTEEEAIKELLDLQYKSKENSKRILKTLSRIDELKVMHAKEIAENAKKQNK